MKLVKEHLNEDIKHLQPRSEEELGDAYKNLKEQIKNSVDIALENGNIYEYIMNIVTEYNSGFPEVINNIFKKMPKDSFEKAISEVLANIISE